jgi:hypothetical protein
MRESYRPVRAVLNDENIEKVLELANAQCITLDK